MYVYSLPSSHVDIDSSSSYSANYFGSCESARFIFFFFLSSSFYPLPFFIILSRLSSSFLHHSILFIFFFLSSSFYPLPFFIILSSLSFSSFLHHSILFIFFLSSSFYPLSLCLGYITYRYILLKLSHFTIFIKDYMFKMY